MQPKHGDNSKWVITFLTVLFIYSVMSSLIMHSNSADTDAGLSFNHGFIHLLILYPDFIYFNLLDLHPAFGSKGYPPLYPAQRDPRYVVL